MKENTFALIITVVNRGHADSVMDTAKDAGAQAEPFCMLGVAELMKTKNFSVSPSHPKRMWS